MCNSEPSWTSALTDDFCLLNHPLRKDKPVYVWVPRLSFWSVEVWTTVFTSGTWKPRDCTAPSRWEPERTGWQINVMSSSPLKHLLKRKHTTYWMFSACLLVGWKFHNLSFQPGLSLIIWSLLLSPRTIKKRSLVCPSMPMIAPSPLVPPVEIWSSTVWPPMCPAKPLATAATRSEHLSSVFAAEKDIIKYTGCVFNPPPHTHTRFVMKTWWYFQDRNRGPGRPFKHIC